jgi:hypothetical protein
MRKPSRSAGKAMSGAGRNPMSVTFARTGERRYAVRAAAEGLPAVEKNPAPGYDPLMPHDMQHFIVERALGIDGAIFGQLAAGGTARTFHAVTAPADARQASRARRKQERRSSRLMSGHREDCARSERATYVCWHDWLSHAEEPALRAQALRMKETATSILRRMPPEERALFTPQMLAEIRSEFSRLSRRWSVLKVGDSFAEQW